MNRKKRILTGDRPTGNLHIGHYVGSLKSRLEFQDEYDTFVLIADVQALTDNFNTPLKIKDNILELLKDYLAVGLDPNKVTFVLQSQIPQIAELTIFFSNLVSVARLMRNPTVKNELNDKKDLFKNSIPYGFLGYPVSQAADISIFDADLVPVGDDQAPHVEQTIEIVKKFNSVYGDTLKVPTLKLGTIPRLIGTDGKSKMSKSMNNTINFSDSTQDIKKKIMQMYTDPKRIHQTDPGEIKGNPVFIYHNAFNPNKEEIKDLENRYRKGQVGDIEVKEKLFNAIEAFISPIRDKRLEFNNKDDYLYDVLKEGTLRASDEAQKTILKVRESMKLLNF
ncbi:MAG: tryptophan--tRNA ligase [Patescibacteria group bacterium]